MSAHLRDSVLLARATADRLMRSVTDLLDLERIRDGSVRIAPIPTSGSDIAAAAVDALTRLAAGRRVRLTARDARGGWALADRDRTAQALAILISCVVCAATEGALIRVAVTRPSAGCVRLTVEDPAGAIQPERRAALAAQIERVGSDDAPPAVTDQPITVAALDRAGYGDPDVRLGLAIARALVERQGGTIGAGAHPHDDAVCWVELPAAPDETASLVLID